MIEEERLARGDATLQERMSPAVVLGVHPAFEFHGELLVRELPYAPGLVPSCMEE